MSRISIIRLILWLGSLAQQQVIHESWIWSNFLFFFFCQYVCVLEGRLIGFVGRARIVHRVNQGRWSFTLRPFKFVEWDERVVTSLFIFWGNTVTHKVLGFHGNLFYWVVNEMRNVIKNIIFLRLSYDFKKRWKNY